jgi:TonB family protein
MVSPVKVSDHGGARRAAPWIRRGGGAVLMSAVVHAAAAVSIGGVLAFAPASPRPATEPATVDVTVITAPDVPLPQSAAPTAPPEAQMARTPVASHRRLTPRPTPAVPTPPKASPPVPLAAPIAPPPTDEPGVMFALSAGTVASGPALAAPAAPSSGLATRSSTSGNSAGAGSSDVAVVNVAVAGEREVDVPARLLAAGPLAYPPAARQAQIEIDFPLEIVVDATGRVVSARAVSRAGYGLDEAALLGIRGYRFSPAMRAGHAVAVRMRWTVQFRLR